MALIGLYDVDSKIPNLALMKLARYHLECGDVVERYDPQFPLDHASFDKVYASKVFAFTDGQYMDPERMIIGGTGHDMTVNLPDEIEVLKPDYSLYPDFNHNIGFTMRGCRFQCEFCIVPKKEGRPASTNTIDDLVVQDSDFLVLLDNDPFGNPDWKDRFAEIKDRNLKVNFSQGINIRIISEEQAHALKSVRFKNTNGTKSQATFAWDQPKDERLIKRGIARCKAAGIKPWQMQFFILIGYDSTPEEDLHRVQMILDEGCDPYVMPFNKFEPYQKAFARWCNTRICKSVLWSDYTYGSWPRSTDAA
ncbi:MAG: hypothetical protein ACNI26_13245 [Terasakiella sp.]|uniref:hypothetical protein n=1 Tax=unclassified Terasakiella TaxID=2614952 RepID=UPI003B000F26